MIKHWLYGEINLKQEIKKETECMRCIHFKVCNIANVWKDKLENMCINFTFGNSSAHYSCGNCLHRFTKWDKKQPINCFKCKYFINK